MNLLSLSNAHGNKHTPAARAAAEHVCGMFVGQEKGNEGSHHSEEELPGHNKIQTYLLVGGEIL